jgi:AGCS family alanine or glycine:cation symporter
MSFCCLTVKVQNLEFSFQALSMSLAGGEYCRCSYSDCFEDPELYFDVDGCFFWSKYRFVEATLAQIYKEKHLGEFRGGPAFYIED